MRKRFISNALFVYFHFCCPSGGDNTKKEKKKLLKRTKNVGVIFVVETEVLVQIPSSSYTVVVYMLSFIHTATLLHPSSCTLSFFFFLLPPSKAVDSIDKRKYIGVSPRSQILILSL